MNAPLTDKPLFRQVIYNVCKGRAYPGSTRQGLMLMDISGDFAAIFYKEANFCDFLFAFLHTRPLL